MARKTVVTLTDDIDGKPADVTVTFGLDGVGYEIDLRETNANKLRKALEPYLSAARKAGFPSTGARRGGRGGRGSASASDRERSSQIRAWAKKHDLPVSERGRIAANIVEAFEANDPGKVTGRAIPQSTFSS